MQTAHLGLPGPGLPGGALTPPSCITSLAVICDAVRQWPETCEKATKRKFPHWPAANQSQI